MSMDKSLKTAGALSKHRNVLKRAERILKLQDEGRWPEDQGPFGLVKVAHRKVKVGGKEKKKEETAEAAAVEGAAPAAEAAAAAPATDKGKAKATKKEAPKEKTKEKGKGKEKAKK